MAKHETVVDSNTGKMSCSRCGEEIDMPYGAIAWVVSVMEAFNKEHERCEKGGRERTFFANRDKGQAKVSFHECVFGGDPPHPFTSWMDWGVAQPFKGVLIQALTPDDIPIN